MTIYTCKSIIEQMTIIKCHGMMFINVHYDGCHNDIACISLSLTPFGKSPYVCMIYVCKCMCVHVYTYGCKYESVYIILLCMSVSVRTYMHYMLCQTLGASNIRHMALTMIVTLSQLYACCVGDVCVCVRARACMCMYVCTQVVYYACMYVCMISV